MGQPILPQELIELIVHNLFDDLESLRACALVSSQFLPSTRCLIFSHIRIGPLDEGDSVTPLHDFLIRAPVLPSRVVSLHLCDDIMLRQSWIEDHTPASAASCVMQLSLLLTSLSRLAVSIRSGFLHWANISVALRTTFHRVLSMPTLTHLEITGLYGLPLTLFAHCPALESATLKWTTFDERDTVDFAGTLAACATSPKIHLRTLSLDLDPRPFGLFVRWILHPESPLDLTRLTSLGCTVQDPRNDMRRLQQLLRLCAATIEALTVKDPYEMLSLDRLPRLDTLCVETSMLTHIQATWLADSVTVPPRPLHLVLRVQIDGGDPDLAPLGVLHRFASITVELRRKGAEARKREEMVDVTQTFMTKELETGTTVRVLRLV
ncbi:hypothetical protein C8J57DRAFT_679050 [Mycena rebaudengoi]|nr:hypothetical protein C8J57DRAFT_679050 [Mycena rebaudengoi]